MHLNKICPVCHQSFEARRKDQVYCIVPIIVEKNIIKKHTIAKIGL